MPEKFAEVLLKLERNDPEVCKETVRVLLKIADNIIKDSSNRKIRTLQKSNSNISNKILKVNGGIECLKCMGFEENDTSFILPMSASLVGVQIIQKKLNNKYNQLLYIAEKNQCSSSKTSNESTQDQNEYIKKINLPPLTLMFLNPFLVSIEEKFHSALIYDNKDLQKRSLDVIPVIKLEIAAQKRLRSFQGRMKNEEVKIEIGIQDMLILELLKWFKEEFFTWVDNPDCIKCGNVTKFSHMCEDPQLLIYTGRVEMHKCATCNALTPFPRYNDLNILLETRKGRCGEWANVFTLFSKAMGWDARIVYVEEDHVWTEIYSISQMKWLHCDPCENSCDNPLMYETGWGVKISYVIAYSSDEVQDVTWRYSCTHKEVLGRRKKCSEKELIDAVIKLRAKRQENFSLTKKTYLTKRLLFELVDFLVEKKPKEEDYQGRLSGSTAWKLSRGETKIVPFTWKFDNKFKNKSVSVRYSCAFDKYEIICEGIVQNTLSGWNSGVFNLSDVFKKEELDWKQVYLARVEGSNTGIITWKFETNESNLFIDTISVSLKHQVFENGIVSIKICSEDSCLLFPPGKDFMKIEEFSGSKFIKIMVSLSGGRGDVAWQHAQLFRQKLNSENEDFPFVVNLTFK